MAFRVSLATHSFRRPARERSVRSRAFGRAAWPRPVRAWRGTRPAAQQRSIGSVRIEDAIARAPSRSASVTRSALPSRARSTPTRPRSSRMVTASPRPRSVGWRYPAGRKRNTSMCVAPTRSAVWTGIGSIRPPSTIRSPPNTGASPPSLGSDALARTARISSPMSANPASTRSDSVSSDVASARNSEPMPPQGPGEVQPDPRPSEPAPQDRRPDSYPA